MGASDECSGRRSLFSFRGVVGVQRRLSFAGFGVWGKLRTSLFRAGGRGQDWRPKKPKTHTNHTRHCRGKPLEREQYENTVFCCNVYMRCPSAWYVVRLPLFVMAVNAP